MDKDGHEHLGDVLWLGSYPGALRLGPFREGLSRTFQRRTTALAPPPHLSSIIFVLAPEDPFAPSISKKHLHYKWEHM